MRVSASPLGVAGAGTLVQPALSARPLLSRLALPERAVRVWLPPGYDGERRFPVLYVHDGQHVMSPSVSRSWALGETLSRLIAAGDISSPVVVMIDSVGANQPGDAGPDFYPIVRRRWLEYADANPFGDAYLAYVCDTLKPAIDAQFRTLAAPEHTSAMGSSMGGLAAFLALWRRPEVFGNALCFSPVFQGPLVADVALRAAGRLAAAQRGSARDGPRLYIDNGGDTAARRVPLIEPADGADAGWWWLDTQLQPGVDAMRTALRLRGVDFDYHREPGGRHNERAWGRRAERPLRYLYGTAVKAREY